MIDESKRDKRNDEIKQTSGFCKLNKSHNYQPRLFDVLLLYFFLVTPIISIHNSSNKKHLGDEIFCRSWHMQF